MNSLARTSAMSLKGQTSRAVIQAKPVMRGYATAAPASNPGGPSAKLSFRFTPKNVPIELWPMGFIISAGVLGGSFALYHHMAHDDLRHHHNEHGEQFRPPTSDSQKPPMTATKYEGNGSAVTN